MGKKNKPSTSPKVFGSSRPVPDSHLTIDNHNTCPTDCQVNLSPTYTEQGELAQKFQPKHAKSIYLSKIYYRLGKDKKAQRVNDCGAYLEFAHEVDFDGVISDKGKLHKAFFCRDRFCPMCAWRKTLKLYSQVSQIIPHIEKEYKCLFLTLTVPNCKESDFSQTVDRLMKAWYSLSNNRKWKKVIKGYFRVLEVTRNKNPKSKSFKTLHPHFHVILVVSKSYGKKNGDYITQQEFLNMWRAAYGDERITQVDIRAIKNKDVSDVTNVDMSVLMQKAIAEVCKYPFKDSDFLDERLSEEEQDRLLEILSNGLHHRRISHFGGIFKELYNKLGLEDVEDDKTDLTHIEDTISLGIALLITKYHWGMGCYNLLNKSIEYKKEVI